MSIFYDPIMCRYYLLDNDKYYMLDNGGCYYVGPTPDVIERMIKVKLPYHFMLP